jgi:hypothetical protein
VTSPPGPGHVTNKIWSLDMAKRNRDLARRGPAPSPPGAARPPGRHPVTPSRSGTVLHRVVPAHLACRIGARARAGERDAWPAVAAIALGSFALVFSEVIPVGLLADISGHLGVSIGTGGLMVVVPAVAAATVAAAGSLALLGRAGAAISAAPAGSADPARERGREAPAPSHGATGGAGTSAHRTR